MTDIELERVKIYQDSFKHMTTFCSGAILLASAVTGALFLPKPEAPVQLAISISLFVLGALFAMLGLASVPRHIDSNIDGSSTEAASLSSLRSLLSFSVVMAFFGLVTFVLFASENLRLSV